MNGANGVFESDGVGYALVGLHTISGSEILKAAMQHKIRHHADEFCVGWGPVRPERTEQLCKQRLVPAFPGAFDRKAEISVQRSARAAKQFHNLGVNQLG